METGSRVAARRERERGRWPERMFRTSRGPQRSRSWKPGKRMAPIFVGGGGGVVILGRQVFLRRELFVEGRAYGRFSHSGVGGVDWVGGGFWLWAVMDL